MLIPPTFLVNILFHLPKKKNISFIHLLKILRATRIKVLKIKSSEISLAFPSYVDTCLFKTWQFIFS